MDRIVPFAPAKIVQIREAGKKALLPGEFAVLDELLNMLAVQGMTPYINTQLGKLMAKFGWSLEVTESPMWDEALVACDGAFLLSELKHMCINNDLSPSGHKKELCARLYRAQVERVVEVMQPIIEEAAPVSYLKEGERRYTTVHERFEIDCSYCGFLSTETSLSKALEKARSVRVRHKSAEEVVTVFDRMAVWGACQKWDVEGRCIGYKGR